LPARDLRPAIRRSSSAFATAGGELRAAIGRRSRCRSPGFARVARLLSIPGPALLDAAVDPDALSLPPHITFGEAEGFSRSLAKQALHGNPDEVIKTVRRNVRIV
jgi:hypothetical protein